MATAKTKTAARRARVERETGETRIDLKIDLDGTGTASIDTGVPFLDHSLVEPEPGSDIQESVISA